MPSFGAGFHGFGVGDHEFVLQGRAHALAREHFRAAVHVEFGPFLLGLADHARAIGLGQAVGVNDFESHVFHAGDHGCRRRGAGGHCTDLVFDALAQFRAGVDQGIEHYRGAAEMADPVTLDGINIASSRTWRRQTFTPATTARLQGKHQPLQ